MRVLQVVPYAGRGGLQDHARRLLRSLRTAGVDVAWAGPEALDGASSYTTAALVGGPSAQLRFIADLRRAARAFRPDVVHGHGLRLAPPLRTAQATVHSRFAPVVTCHGVPVGTVARTARVVRLTGVPVVAIGRGPAAQLEQQGLRSRVIPNSVSPAPPPYSRGEIADLFGVPETAALAVFSGRLVDQKDPVTAARAVAGVPDLHGLFVGSGGLAPAVEAAARLAGAGHRITMAGWRDDARRIVGAADVALMTSEWEGLPYAALEAFSAGVPLVATACTGLTEWLRPGLDALLAPVGDVTALTAALGGVLGDEVVRRTVIEGGRQALALLTPEHEIASYVQLYDDLVTGGNRPW